MYKIITGLAEEEGAAALTEALEDETLEEEFSEPGMDLLEEHGDALTKAPKGACVRACRVLYVLL